MTPLYSNSGCFTLYGSIDDVYRAVVLADQSHQREATEELYFAIRNLGLTNRVWNEELHAAWRLFNFNENYAVVSVL